MKSYEYELLAKHGNSTRGLPWWNSLKLAKFCSKPGIIWSKNKRTGLWTDQTWCQLVFNMAARKKHAVRYPALLSGREQEILHGRISKLCPAEMKLRVKLPHGQPDRFFDSKHVSETVNLWLGHRSKRYTRIRQQFSWSRPVKGEEGRRDAFVLIPGMWERRGGREVADEVSV